MNILSCWAPLGESWGGGWGHSRAGRRHRIKVGAWLLWISKFWREDPNGRPKNSGLTSSNLVLHHNNSSSFILTAISLILQSDNKCLYQYQKIRFIFWCSMSVTGMDCKWLRIFYHTWSLSKISTNFEFLYSLSDIRLYSENALFSVVFHSWKQAFSLLLLSGPPIST